MKILIFLFVITISIQVQGQSSARSSALVKVKIVRANSLNVVSSQEYVKNKNNFRKISSNKSDLPREVVIEFRSKKIIQEKINANSNFDSDNVYNSPNFEVINYKHDHIGNLNFKRNTLVSNIYQNDKLTFIYSVPNKNANKNPVSLTIIY